MRPRRRTFDDDTSFAFLDPMSRYLLMVHRIALRLSHEHTLGAEQLRVEAAGLPPMPAQMRRTATAVDVYVGVLTSSRGMLRSASIELNEQGAPHAAALAEAFSAEINGDAVRALDLVGKAVAGEEVQQPPVRSIALVVRAQLLEASGAHEEALDLLSEAVGLTQLRGNVQPFLGFSRLGAPLRPLLAQLAARESIDTDWLRTLLDLTARRPALVEQYDAALVTDAERDLARDDIVRPVLTVREREVLRELARGSTYALIAANLYVSENTVKTHVGGLYRKLAATRRSEALATARSLGLI